MYHVLILVFAIVMFTVLAFKGVTSIPLAGIVSLVTVLLARLPVLETLLGPFMEAGAGYVQSYFFVFFLGAVFSALYEESNAAKSIANFLVKLTNGKHIVVLIFLITAFLTFGGISGFVVYFVMYPITLRMFHKNDMSRKLIPAAITAGCWTISMVAPGSPSIQNVIAMKSLGTAATAALVPGIAGVLAELILIIVWFEYRTRKLEKDGRRFYDPELPPLPESELNFEDDPNEKLPSIGISVIPIAVILILFNGFKMAVEGAVFFGIVAACILFIPYVTKGFQGYINMFNRGGANAGSALLNTAIVVGFGGVAKNTKGFQIAVESLLNINMHPLVYVAVAVAICSGLAGSASGGIGISFDALKDTFIALSIPLEYVHRIAVISAGTLDTLPHQGGQQTIFAITHMNHKHGYFDIFITQLIIPILALFVVIPLMSMGL